jgi:hypothetical protein
VDSKRSIVSVGVSDSPAGYFHFHGYVKYKDGTLLGLSEKDEPQFDPGVLTEGDKTYLYTGFCAIGDTSRTGAMATILGPDMVTILEDPVFVAPSQHASEGTGFEGHAFFEAPSMRKIGSTYYFIYSSVLMHELCYATSQEPTKGFVYRGTIISNADIGIDTYKPENQPMFYGGNNHGSIIEINKQWYVFYHRHTNGTNFSRQGCMEKIHINADGSIDQVALTSCGANEGPLIGRGEYPTYIAANLYCHEPSVYTDFTASWMNNQFPKITQDGKDGDKEIGYIANMKSSATAGFKYFMCEKISEVKIKTRGYGRGDFEVRTKWDGPVLGVITIQLSNVWQYFTGDIVLPDGINSLYFTFVGEGSVSFGSFTLD